MTEIEIDVTKEQWLTALESGNFKQFQNLLRDGGRSFCCLGVMCEIGSNVKRAVTSGYKVKNSPSFTGGLGLHAPKWMTRNQEAACVCANDSLNWTFAQIAEWWRETDGAVKVHQGSYVYMPDYSFDTDGESN